MTKRLEELFNLGSKDQESPVPIPVNEEIVAKAAEIASMSDSLQAVSSITKNLPPIQELNDLQDSDLDELADKAEKAYDDLMDLGMNVEVRYASRIFEVASSMLGHAITAKSNKIEKKLKAIDIQLKKYKIDKETPDSGDGQLLNGEGYIITDRNELLKKLGQK